MYLCNRIYTHSSQQKQIMQTLTEKTYHTDLGDIRYWTNASIENAPTLVFLPGLTADHRLFLPQIEHFRNSCRLLVWDAPGHHRSRPFSLQFSLMKKAVWLHEILRKEDIERPILVGQSMGGYVAQCYMQQFPEEVAGIIAIDSAPLQRCYTSWWEIALLRHCS